jgi:hypothetical protein
MTDNLFFDTDCLSAFLWVGNENILVNLYGNRIIVPKQVYDELSRPFIPHLKQKTDNLIQSGYADVGHMLVGSEEHELYMALTSKSGAEIKSIRQRRSCGNCLSQTK